MEREKAVKPTILVVDDEKNMRRVLSATLAKAGFNTVEAADGLEALDLLKGASPDCVLTDLKMPGLDGMQLLEKVAATDQDLPVVLLTAHGTVNTAVEAMKKGAFDYLTKPFDKSELINIIRKATKTRERAKREPSARPGDPIASKNPKMLDLFRLIGKVAQSPTTVLFTGESGTGKEVFVRLLHEKSNRNKKPYIRVNCAAIPATLVESELFGYEKGAFTGAVGNKPGRFELADTGTLFLDEIGAIPLETQVKLLRAIQEQEFERVGGVRTLRVDVRLVAATNVDLKEKVAEGAFREDLFYRLNVVHFRLPPLRERLEDLEMLVQGFLLRFNRKLGRNVKGLSEEAWSKLRGHDWPGNIRELENTLERSVLLGDGEIVQVGDLPEELRGSSSRAPRSGVALGDLKEASREAAAKVEIELIRAALEKTGGNVTRAAKILGLSRKGLQIKMREYGLDRKQVQKSET